MFRSSRFLSAWVPARVPCCDEKDHACAARNAKKHQLPRQRTTNSSDNVRRLLQAPYVVGGVLESPHAAPRYNYAHRDHDERRSPLPATSPPRALLFSKLAIISSRRQTQALCQTRNDPNTVSRENTTLFLKHMVELSSPWPPEMPRLLVARDWTAQPADG